MKKYVCTYREAGDRAYELASILTKDKSKFEGNFRLWAWYCRRFPFAELADTAYEKVSLERQGEIHDAVTAFQHWLTEKYGKQQLKGNEK